MRSTSERPPSKILVPVRYGAWLSGDLGRTLEHALMQGLAELSARVTRLPRGFLVEAPEEVGVLLEAVHRATVAMERQVQAAYPVFYTEIGPVWTGTLQAVFEPPGTSLEAPPAEPVA